MLSLYFSLDYHKIVCTGHDVSCERCLTCLLDIRRRYLPLLRVLGFYPQNRFLSSFTAKPRQQDVVVDERDEDSVGASRAASARVSPLHGILGEEERLQEARLGPPAERGQNEVVEKEGERAESRRILLQNGQHASGRRGTRGGRKTAR